MSRKRFFKVLQVRISGSDDDKLEQASEITGLSESELARLSLRLALPKLVDKLPAAEREAEPS